MDPRTTTASAILRRCTVALKTYALYPPPSPVTDRAVGELLEGLQQYIGTNGPFTVRVSRRSFRVNDSTFKDATSASLAFHLYGRKVIGFTITPGVTAPDLLAFLTVVRQDRATLEGSGGIAGGLHQAGVRTIKVMEIMMAFGAGAQDKAWDALWDLMGDSEGLSPEHRQVVVDILRSGPAAIGGLFEQLRTMLANTVDAPDLDLPQTTYDVIKNLDRVILDQSVADQEQFYSNLAAAILLLEDPVRIPLEQTLAGHEPHDETARVLLDHLSEQRLVKVVPRSSLESQVVGEGAGAAGSPDQPALDPEMQILHAQLAGTGGPVLASLVDLAGGTPRENRRVDVQAMDDASLTREVLCTLVDLLHNQTDESAIAETAASLEGKLPWLIENQEYPLLRTMLEGLKGAADRSSIFQGAFAVIANSLAQDRLVRTLAEALWNGRGAEIEDDIRTILALLSDRVVVRLMTLLGEDSRVALRRMLCDLIVIIGRAHIDDVGRFATDARWYLTRNVAYILGRIGDPRGLAYIARLATHADHRVRSEAVTALARIGTQDAETHLIALLNDPDDRVRLKAILSLSDTGVSRAAYELLRLLELPDPLHRYFTHKQEIIAALIRAHASEALPALTRLSRRRLVLGRRRRALRHMALEAVASIRSVDPPPTPPRLDERTEGGRT